MTIPELQKDLLTKHQDYLNTLNNYHQMVINSLEKEFPYKFDFNNLGPACLIEIDNFKCLPLDSQIKDKIESYIKQFNTSFVSYSLY